MRGSLVLAWRKGNEEHSLVRGKEEVFHHFVSRGGFGKKTENLSPEEGARLILQVLEDSSCEASPDLAFDLICCLYPTASASDPRMEAVDCGHRTPRRETLEDEEERLIFQKHIH